MCVFVKSSPLGGSFSFFSRIDRISLSNSQGSSTTQ